MWACLPREIVFKLGAQHYSSVWGQMSTTPIIPRPSELSDFRLMTAVFECRHLQKYLLWDHAGAVWSELTGLKPGLRPIKVEPGETSFRLGDQLEFTVKLDSFRIQAHNPTSLDDFARHADDFTSVVIRTLDVQALARVGFRQIFVREYSNLSQATSEMLRMNLVRVPVSPCFGLTAGAPSTSRYAINIEDEHKGCHIQVGAHMREFSPELPFGWEGSPITKVEKPTLSLDFDYYAVSATVHQIRPVEWIRQAAHVVRRDACHIIGGE
jgi:hypothetical protein